MSVECMPSKLGSDVRCAVCGQGFLLFSSRAMNQRRDQVRVLIQAELRRHHEQCHEGHPEERFTMYLPQDELQAALA